MKKKILFVIAVLLVGAATLTVDKLLAQNNPPAATPPVQFPPPGNHPGLNPAVRSRMIAGNYRRTVIFLKQTKVQLEGAKEDYDGHRQTAIDACDKAIKELEAVQAAIEEAAKATNQVPVVSPPATNQ